MFSRALKSSSSEAVRSKQFDCCTKQRLEVVLFFAPGRLSKLNRCPRLMST
jgi:hypothetical protein